MQTNLDEVARLPKTYANRSKNKHVIKSESAVQESPTQPRHTWGAGALTPHLPKNTYNSKDSSGGNLRKEYNLLQLILRSELFFEAQTRPLGAFGPEVD